MALALRHYRIEYTPSQHPSIRGAGAFRPAAQASPGDTQIDSAVKSASLEDESI